MEMVTFVHSAFGLGHLVEYNLDSRFGNYYTSVVGPASDRWWMME